MTQDSIPAAADFYPPSSRDVSLRKRLLQMSGKASFASNVDKADFHAMLNGVIAELLRKDAQIAELRMIAAVAATRPGLGVNLSGVLFNAGAGEPLTETQKSFLRTH